MKQPAKPSRVLAVVGLAVFLSVLDLFIVNIAFPDLRRDFEGSSLSGLSWVLTTYAIVYAAVLVPAGRLGDLYGRRLLFVIGLALFTLGSALCAVAPTLELLVAARVLQGIGAAALTPNSLGLVLPLYPPEKRSTVIGAWAGIGAVGASVAPPLGGLLVEVSWRLIFIVNVPLGLLAIVLALRLAPEVRDARATRLPDVLGIALLIAAVGLTALGLTQGPHWGWDERVFGRLRARGGPRRGLPAPLRPPSRAGRRARAPARARLRARRALDAAVLGRLRGPAARQRPVVHPGVGLLGAEGRPRLRAGAAAGGHDRRPLGPARRRPPARRLRRDRRLRVRGRLPVVHHPGRRGPRLRERDPPGPGA